MVGDRITPTIQVSFKNEDVDGKTTVNGFGITPALAFRLSSFTQITFAYHMEELTRPIHKSYPLDIPVRFTSSIRYFTVQLHFGFLRSLVRL
jgi:hypothetical protein